KLLRTLETKTITRIGETKERSVDVRLVAATNLTLDVEVAQGRFRADLMYRLAAAKGVLPPLRARRCEIPLLARTLLAAACQQAGRATKTITPAAMQVLLTHDWPGNVRELKNVMDYVCATAPDDNIEPFDLQEYLGSKTPPPVPVAVAEVPAEPVAGG